MIISTVDPRVSDEMFSLCIPVRIVVHGGELALLDDPVLLWEIRLCECLSFESVPLTR
jgi:hypothetical protein